MQKASRMSGEMNASAIALGASVPQIVMGVDDAAAHARKESRSDADEAASASPSSATRALRALCVGVAYLCAALTGWSLYDWAAPFYRALPELAHFQQPQKNGDTEQLLQATQKITSQLQAMQARIDAMNAAAPRKEEKQAPNVEELNGRIDAARAETAAEIRQLSNSVEQLQREMNARLSEIGAASRQSDSGAREATPRLTTALREDGDRRAHKRRSDAFDPTLHPHAPGAPRPLGANMRGAR
jgi:hypothetical protein